MRALPSFLIVIFLLTGAAPLFVSAQEAQAAQEAAPELVGPLTQEAILEALPEWQDRMVAYEAAYGAIEALKEVGDFVQVEVFFGSWCADSAEHVPAFFQVVNLVNSPRFEVSHMAVPRPPEQRLPYVAGKDVEKFPTFIVLVNGIEQGRIVETPARSVEEDLLALLGR